MNQDHLKRERSSEESSESEQSAHKRQKQQKKQETRQYVRGKVPPSIDIKTFRFPDRESMPLRGDDSQGHMVVELGDNLSSRFKVLCKMGEGTFGRVLECWDRLRREHVAVKVIRNVDKYRQAAMIEMEVLNTLEKNDAYSEQHCIFMKEWFDYRGHVCMVFDKLGPSLFDFIKRNHYKGFPATHVQSYARQILESVAFMAKLKLTHTDLKPENILTTKCEYTKKSPPAGRRLGKRIPLSTEIKVIDFGSATFEDQYHSSVVSTRHYRAPEIILGLGWSYPCDLWSVGCIIAELVTGDALFQTHENLEHLALMEKMLGPLPAVMGLKADEHARKFFEGGRLKWPEGASNQKSVEFVEEARSLKTILESDCDSSLRPHIPVLLDLVQKCMEYEPGRRITAEAALQHPFFAIELDEDPYLVEAANELKQTQDQTGTEAAT